MRQASAVMQIIVLDCCGEEGAEPKGKAFDLVYGDELWVMTERIRLKIQAAETSFPCRLAGLSFGDSSKDS